MTKSEKLKGLKVLRPRFYLGELRFIAWALDNLEIQYRTLLGYREDLESQEYKAKWDFIRGAGYKSWIELKAIRKDLAEISRLDLHRMLYATRAMQRRIEGLIEGKKPHPSATFADYDKNLIWYQ